MGMAPVMDGQTVLEPRWRLAKSVSMSVTRTNGKHGKHVSTVGTTQWTAGVHCTDPFPDRSILENKRPDLSDIALFVEVAKRRSFSRAAEALGMPNSSLSRRISRLERAVGVTPVAPKLPPR